MVGCPPPCFRARSWDLRSKGGTANLISPDITQTQGSHHSHKSHTPLGSLWMILEIGGCGWKNSYKATLPRQLRKLLQHGKSNDHDHREFMFVDQRPTYVDDNSVRVGQQCLSLSRIGKGSSRYYVILFKNDQAKSYYRKEIEMYFFKTTKEEILLRNRGGGGFQKSSKNVLRNMWMIPNRRNFFCEEEKMSCSST